ncbi:DUF397 domain-containing protein [Actinomadura barringtoniae]|uniref:DUF397 domain-containing protein n=1 Tax=Actinomadura barringtoniae TaxID=1427535 RepID=A0A939P9I2_9ACTN|nr:DUF397 domain-containing protein [Actinomadura barringtoniae]MBO2447962.1 DUF397 domain-containing protein [Actinomadura barringtoniae]
MRRAHWRKSSYSGGGGGDCVEIASWRKSSHSGSDGGECIEVAPLSPHIAVRDSKDPDGPKLVFDAADWRTFTRRIKAGAQPLPTV